MAVKRVGMEIGETYGQAQPLQYGFSCSIPSKFVSLDSNVTAEDRYVNVRDEMVKRANHNILLARRCKRNIMHVDPSKILIGSSYGYPIGQRYPISAFYSAPEMLLPLYISQNTNQVQVILRCCRTRAVAAGDHDPQVAFCLCPHGSTRTVSASEIQSITTAYSASEASCADYTWTIDLPTHIPETSIVYGQMLFDLYMLAYAPTNDTPYSSGAAITSYGPSFVLIAGGLSIGGVGDVLKIGDDYRMIQEWNSNTCYVDEGWSRKLLPGTDTVDVYHTMGVWCRSLSIFEIASTTLADFTGRA